MDKKLKKFFLIKKKKKNDTRQVATILHSTELLSNLLILQWGVIFFFSEMHWKRSGQLETVNESSPVTSHSLS